MDLGAVAAQTVAAIRGVFPTESITVQGTARQAWVLSWAASSDSGEGGQVVVRDWKVASETRLAVGDRLVVRGVPLRVAKVKYTEVAGVHYLSVAEGD